MNAKLVLSGAGALALIIGASALAQPAPASGPSPDLRGQPMAGRLQHREEWRQKKAQELRAVLQIRPDQEQAFAAYEAALDARPGRGGEGGRRWNEGGSEAMTTPQRLDLRLEMMNRRMAEFRRRAEATKAFYAALSPQQQRAFDALEDAHGRRWGGGREDRGPQMGEGGRRPWGPSASPSGS